MIDNFTLQLVTIFLYSVLGAYGAMPYIISKLKQHGYMVKDMHKFDKPEVPAMGGIAILAGITITLAISQILRGKPTIPLFVFYYIVIIYAMYGLLDDMFHFKSRYDKIPIVMVLSFPIVSLLDHSGVTLFGYYIELGAFFLFVIAPVYMMVVANLINIHAGFNGMGPGTAILVMIATSYKSYLMYGTANLMYIMPVLGASMVFLTYNWYPSKVFDGNVGAFLMGGALGAFLIINKLEVFGAICLIPNIITFILDTYYLVIRKVKDVEFPDARKDGIIVPPKEVRYKSFKNVLCTKFRMTELKGALISLSATMVCCVFAIWLF